MSCFYMIFILRDYYKLHVWINYLQKVVLEYSNSVASKNDIYSENSNKGIKITLSFFINMDVLFDIKIP